MVEMLGSNPIAHLILALASLRAFAHTAQNEPIHTHLACLRHTWDLNSDLDTIHEYAR